MLVGEAGRECDLLDCITWVQVLAATQQMLHRPPGFVGIPIAASAGLQVGSGLLFWVFAWWGALWILRGAHSNSRRLLQCLMNGSKLLCPFRATYPGVHVVAFTLSCPLRQHKSGWSSDLRHCNAPVFEKVLNYYQEPWCQIVFRSCFLLLNCCKA